MTEAQTISNAVDSTVKAERKPYHAPELIHWGEIHAIVQSVAGSGPDNAPITCCAS